MCGAWFTIENILRRPELHDRLAVNKGVNAVEYFRLKE